MGEIGDGIQTKFDDRKFRFDDAIMSEDGKMLFIKLGMTHYKECEDCRKWDEKTRGRMIRKGETQFQDPNAYFSRGCGIAVTPITSNGHIFIGKRKVQDPGSGYAGALAAVNGWIDYPWNQINTNPDPIIKVDFRVDAFREMKEEFGINPTDVDSLIFSGVVSAPNRADTDFVYLAPLKISDEEFLARYSKRQDREHEDLVQIVNYSSKMELLETGRLSDSRDSFEVLYSLRFSLEQIKSTEMAV
jgi:8-oxo-dGTP pyrophosphatase MutT (NUDIX family)